MTFTFFNKNVLLYLGRQNNGTSIQLVALAITTRLRVVIAARSIGLCLYGDNAPHNYFIIITLTIVGNITWERNKTLKKLMFL